MARKLSLSNGSMLVATDENGFVRDFYFPKVGMENHVSEKCQHRLGIYIDGIFSWLNEPNWQTKVNLEGETMIGKIEKTSNHFPVKIIITDAVYNEKNIYLRRFTVNSTDNQKHNVKLFFCQEFQMAQNEIGDTAYFYPTEPSIIHYHGSRVCLVSAQHNNNPFTDFTTGVFGIQGKEGSYKDAEDGQLTKNPIEHGRTDSVISIELSIDSDKPSNAYYFICAGESIQEVQTLHYYVKDKNPEHLFQSTSDFWHAWLKKTNFKLLGLSEEIQTMFYHSLLYCRGHCDQGGAIIASADSGMLHGGKDTYSYMWPRDASFTAMTLSAIGETQVAKRFFTLMNKIITPSGYLMHKYLSDGSLGSSWHPYLINNKTVLPIQQDETALVIYALFDYYEKTKDLEFIENIYNSYIRKSGDFFIEHMDEKTGLPKPSYDLWEEKFGIHTFTCASVFGALNAISNFALILGKRADAIKYAHLASKIKTSILKNLYNNKTETFYKSLIKNDQGEYIADKTVDASSAFGIWYFKVLDLEDERLSLAVKKTEEILFVKGNVGGIARYENDKYYNESGFYPGNPWLITTFWYAQIKARNAKKQEDLLPVIDVLNWACNYKYGASVLAEQLDPVTGGPVSAGPLVWSHADFIKTVLEYLDALKRLGLCLDCNPI